ncbi:unnamed protein product [Paramecium pentaurelia]|uniref:Sphingolipid delta4-desaturase N-terminal domain-containing protein n=1 Tax=Paramecium pentaurelia TaxID=43138 RepID=A0A8S1S1Y4_9CILI|nr:unnamed protein product [Paramecium pentaurelia]
MKKNKFGLLEDITEPGLIKKSNDVSWKNDEIYKQTNFDKNTTYFHIMGHEESHAVRRREILKNHPEIQVLFGNDINSAWLGITFVLIQFSFITLFSQLNLFWFLITAYVFGATLSHALHVLVHDFTHFTCFESITLNKLMAIWANFGQGVPSAITFGRYHADHHTFLNLEALDPDLPSRLELQYIKGPVMKFLFVAFLPLFYALRPVILRPLKPNAYEVINAVSVFFVDYLIVHYIGMQALLWLLLSTYFGLSVHPFAVHLIAEHYEFINRMETYDYIGWANFFVLNIGYHTEHHDFHMIPWTRLPLLRKMVPEYYENLPCHTNYVNTLLAYIFDGYMGPFSRIVRSSPVNFKQ